MLLYLAITCACVTGLLSDSSAANTNLVFVQRPSYLNVDYSASTLPLSDLKILLLSTLGFSVKKNIQWSGLTSTDPFSTPKATLIFLVDDSTFDVSQFSTNSLKIYQNTSADFEYLHHYFDQTFSSPNYVQTFNELTTTFPTLSNDCDNTNSKLAYIFNVPSSASSDVNSLTSSIGNIISVFNSQCEDQNLLVMLLTVDESLQVHKRSVRQANPSVTGTTQDMALNVATFYNDQYPAIFNLFFWITLAIAVAIYGISYSMWNMDPGLDTVIYRMTSQRIKKDN